MTISQVSYTPFPVPDKSDLPIASSPTGTIYMFGYADTLITNPGIELPACNPCHYWTNPEDLLKWVAAQDKAITQPAFILKMETDIPCNAYHYKDRRGKDCYIYIWAIAPIGGAA